MIASGFRLIPLFIGRGLLAQLSSTSVNALVSCAVSMSAAIVSMSAAIFVILEMSHPRDGIILVSRAPLEAALAIISKQAPE